MKWVYFEKDEKQSYGRLVDETVERVNLSWEAILAGETAVAEAIIPLKQVTLLNPVQAPGKIICIGLNYLDHCRETGIDVPKTPLIFTKFQTSLNDPNAPIEWSESLATQIDFEAELVAVIGKEARNVVADDALDYVAGYTIANDVSARDLQFADGQWVRGKSLDTFCPLGPTYVTADDIPDPQNLKISCTLNGEVMQDSNTKEMIFKRC